MAKPINLIKRVAAGVLGSRKVLVEAAPDPQNALDIFEGEWASKLPPPYAHLRAGNVPLFEDERIDWAVKQLGGIGGKAILELGPLEGGHSYKLEKHGAAKIHSIEANTRAYLKCLIVKELLKLQRVEFVCGNFIEYLKTSPRWDAIFASGVLYHMTNPVELIALCAKTSDHLFLWTQYYDAERIRALDVSKRFTGSTSSEHGGFRHVLHRHEYTPSLSMRTFYGGVRPHSCWMARSDILSALKHFGLGKIEIHFDEPTAASGPSLCLLASRK